MSDAVLINQTMLAELAAQAAAAPRLRKNLNFHAANETPCHRLLNALQPGTYVQPHCHLDSSKEESIIALSGRLGCLIFDSNGKVLSTCVLAPGSDVVGINIPPGVFHSLVALSADSVFFESKQGPYVPIAVAEKSTWAPAEGEAGCADYLEFMLGHFN
ncbi:WbuC family cupin fold metalloprotein [Silvimonas soli]|uniref:WbuC family cupin fold metalloprotein n=1 Tax=Silvimonas soli TaxID=2980100 RepID=UPI0024B3A5A0|nr:WbuC family cupin fold metalloprotein [Silvimonas soli]